MNWLGKFYQWLWFHSEFWLTPVDRRPYTFLWRDWIFTHSGFALSLIIIWYILVGALHIWYPTPALILGIVSTFILAHLVWGSKWIEGQQEFPEYNPDKKVG